MTSTRSRFGRFGCSPAGFAILLTGLVAARFAFAQVSLNFSNADVAQVAKAIGAATDTTIIVDPRVKGQLNLVSDNPVSKERSLKTLEAALRMQGFALVRDHGILKVVPEADAKLQGTPTYVATRRAQAATTSLRRCSACATNPRRTCCPCSNRS